jgi:NADP-dependent 3-hydroxy acid dehydrogenase YdfG
MARPVAFVTGAGSGKGLETATILASSGYDLALFDLNYEPLENLARTLRQQVPRSYLWTETLPPNQIWTAP